MSKQYRTDRRSQVLSSVIRIKEKREDFRFAGESYLSGDVWWYIYDREQTIP